MRTPREIAGEFGECGCEGEYDTHSTECDERTRIAYEAMMEALRFALLNGDAAIIKKYDEMLLSMVQI